MQLDVTWSAAGGLVEASMLLLPETPAEQQLTSPWCSAHRSTRLAVHEGEFDAWQEANGRGDAQSAAWLLRPVVLLWDRPFVCSLTPGGRISWREELPDTPITRQLLARLAGATILDEVAITIEQLMLEQQRSTPADCASVPTAARSV